MFQAFYWDVPAGGTWYDTITAAAPGLKEAGFTHFWFPPPTKGMSGAYSMGYDLYDNYDLGQYNQKGTVETRFGSLAELQAAAAACENVLLDLVANHMMGGDLQVDPADGQSYWQKFQYVHGTFPKDPSCFHPNLEYRWHYRNGHKPQKKNWCLEGVFYTHHQPEILFSYLH